MRYRALAASLVTLSSLVGLGAAAFAQEAPGAAELRDRARASLASGDVQAACTLLEQGYQAAVKAQAAGQATLPPDEVLFDLADCHAKAQKTTVATAEFDQVASGGGPRAGEASARAAALKAPPAGGVVSGMTPPPPVVVVPMPPAQPAPPKEESPTRIGDFMDTRLTWTFGDDDVIHATGQAQPLSPNASIGDRKQYRLFFDNLNSRFGGRENLTHLALYKKMPGFIRGLETEASLILRVDMASLSKNTNNVNQAIYDSGSYIRAFYHSGGNVEGKDGLGVTFWPIDTDRFRLGYLYDISWGGTNASINQSIFPRIQGSSPGMKVQYDSDTDHFSVYAGFKTASLVQVEQTLTPGTSEVEEIRVAQTNFGVLGGLGFDAGQYVHVDLGGGYFQQGKFDLPDVAGQAIYTAGGSARVVVHGGMAVPQSIDFLLYRNDPNKPQLIFRPETYEEGKTTWAVSLEGSNLMQNLKDFDAPGVTTMQAARAVALQGNVKSGYLRGSLTGIFRDLPFVLRNQPSFIPFQTLPDDAKTTNELFFAAAADYHFPKLHLTPGIGAGLQLPATFGTVSSDSASAPSDRTVVVREQGNLTILPANAKSKPIIQARVSVKWDVSKILSAIVWAQVVHDNNGTFVERDPSEGTVALRSFISPEFFGVGTSVQARF